MRCRSWLCTLLLCLLSLHALATVIRVPQDQPTIQAGINAAQNGDTVLVAPGTYYEQINFNGKNIVVTSQGGAAATTIDATQTTGPVVRFLSGETLQARLDGFTIQNGSPCCFPYEGGGIEINNSSPSVVHNIVRHNVCTDSGGGINIYWGSPLIRENTVIRNNCSGGGFGGGISVVGDITAQLIHNIIENNISEFGGGLEFDGGGNSLLFDNRIVNNSGDIQGGGIYLANDAGLRIVQNLVANNLSSSGSQLYLSTPSGSPGFRLINNTIASTVAFAPYRADSAVLADGFNTSAQIINNIISAQFESTALLCNPVYHDGPPVVGFNDAFAANGTAYADSCSGMNGTNGNLSANPLFGGSGQLYYELQAGSPAISAGENLPGLPALDLAGNPRIVGGTVDMGAYEYQGVGR